MRIIQVENIRWNVEDHIGELGGYESACDVLGLPHFLPEMKLEIGDDVSLKEIENEFLNALTRHYGVEAISVDLVEIGE